MAFQTQDAKTISWFYAAAFGRTPVPDSTATDNGDLGGLIFWTNVFIAGEGDFAQFQGNLDAIGDFFVASDEFQAKYPAALTNEQFVTALYDNMLNRAPDLAGFNFWVNELNSGQSRGAVLVDFANTEENQGAIPNQSAALDSFILFIANDNSMPNPVITPEEATTWLADNPTLDASIIDLPLDTTAPTIDADQTATYSEGSTADAILLTLDAADNVGGSGIESFAIVSGDDNHYFEIDADGNISLTAAGAAAGAASNSATVDPDTFTLGVTATDRAGNTSTAVDVVLTVADVTPPALSSALVGPTSIILAYNENLDATKLPLPTDFAVTQNGTTAVSVNSVTISGSSVTLALAAAPTGTVTVSYTPNADTGKQLQDLAGNPAVALANQATQGDTTAPILMSTEPADSATDVAVGVNIVMNFSETVKAGTGNIIIANSADGTDTRTISVTDTSQVTFSGAKMTINPTADLKANGSYTVTMGAGVVEDLVGNDFAGLSGTDLNFSTPGGGGGTEGQIFALTTSTDVIPGLIGSLGTTNTDGDDTIIGGSGSAGGSNTLGSADSINAGKGTDTLKFTSEGSGAAVSVTPNLTSVEKVFIQGLAMGGTVVNMVNATGTTEIWNERSTDAGGVLVTNVQEQAIVGVKGEITGASYYAVAFKDSLVSGANDAITIALDGATLGVLAVGDTSLANEFETLKFVGTGVNKVTTLWDSFGAALNTTKTVEFSGAGSIAIVAPLAATVTTVDATSNSGGVSVDVSATGTLMATGGSGNDTFKMGASLTTADTLAGGAGVNTIGITTGTSLVDSLKVTNFQTLDVGGADANANTYNLSKLTGITKVQVSAPTNATAGNEVIINNLAKGASIEIDASIAGALQVTGDLIINVNGAGAGSPNDTIDVLIKNKAAFDTTGNLVINDIETVNLTSDKGTTSGDVKHTIAQLTDAAATTVAVHAGSGQLAITNLETLALVLFDASAATQKVELTTGADVFTALNGVAFKLGAGNDLLDLTGATVTGDILVTGGAGGDAITLTAAGQVEKLIYTAAGQSNVGVTNSENNFDKIANFTTTEDKIDLKAFGFTGALTSALKVGAAADIDVTTGVLAAGKEANFFGAGADQRAVVIVDDGADTWVYVDANKDGSFNSGDLAIELTGLTGGTIPVLGDFTFV